MLHEQQCQIITHGSPAMTAEEIQQLLGELSERWQLDSANKKITSRFQFKDYHHTIAFVNAVAWIAEQQDHHPELYVSYKSCEVCYTSHATGALSLNDFICAARIEQLLN